MSDEITPTTQPEPEIDPSMKDIEAAFRADNGDPNTPTAPAVPVPTPATVATPDKPADVKPKIDLTPKAVVPTPEDPALEEIADDAPMPPKSADWNKFKKSHNARLTLIRDREATIAKLSVDAEKYKQFESIQKERDELTAKLQEYSVIGDPALTKDIDARISVVSEKAKAGLDPKKAAMLDVIARMPSGDARDKMFEDAMEGVTPGRQSLIAAHLGRLEELSAERESRIEEARTNAGAITQQRAEAQAQQQAQHSQMLDVAFGVGLNGVKTKPGWDELFANPEMAAWIESEAKKIYSGDGTDPRVLAEKATYAAVAPRLMEFAIEKSEKVAELEQTISELRAAKPRVDATWAATPSASEGGDEPFGLGGLAAAMRA